MQVYSASRLAWIQPLSGPYAQLWRLASYQLGQCDGSDEATCSSSCSRVEWTCLNGDRRVPEKQAEAHTVSSALGSARKVISSPGQPQVKETVSRC